MGSHDDRYETPMWRTLWLLLGFALLIGIGVVTVLLPELDDEKEDVEEAGLEATSQE